MHLALLRFLPRPRREAGAYILIVAVGAAFRLACLDLKPAHFDEGVNGWFVDGMTHHGYYHYDPSNFHGPLHFYALFVSQTLLGRNLWALRLPTALASIGCIVLVLAFRSYFSRRACLIAAFAMAVSPGMVFYGRDAIHETWLVFFLLLACGASSAGANRCATTSLVRGARLHRHDPHERNLRHPFRRIRVRGRLVAAARSEPAP